MPIAIAMGPACAGDEAVNVEAEASPSVGEPGGDKAAVDVEQGLGGVQVVVGPGDGKADGETNSGDRVFGKCTDCGGQVEGEVKGPCRCKDCNALKSRLKRLFDKSSGLQGAFETASREDKRDFYIENHKSMGNTLGAAVKEVAERTATKFRMRESKGAGTFLDLEDLTVKYKAKPLQLAGIMKNAARKWDDVREVELYEDPEWQSTAIERESHEDKRVQMISQERTIKRVKTLKSTVPSEAISNKPFTEANIKFIDTSMGMIEDAVTKVGEFMPQVHELEDYISKAAINNITGLECKLKEFRATLATLSANGSGDLSDAKARHNTLKATIKDQLRRIKAQLVEAKALKADGVDIDDDDNDVLINKRAGGKRPPGSAPTLKRKAKAKAKASTSGKASPTTPTAKAKSAVKKHGAK